jgi:undecaprenyl-diphosphatase
MILASHFLHIIDSVTLTTFEIVVQFGAILAVVLSYYKKLLKVDIIKKLIIAFIPTGIAGVVVYPYIKHLFENQKLVALMLLVGGIIILLVEKRHAKHEKEHAKKDISDITDISYKQALSLGAFQAIAIIPGVSRSGAVIVGGLLQNISRKVLVEFTFLLAVPTMFVATLYTLVKKHNELSLDSVSPIVVGTIVSFAVSFAVIRLALSYIRKHSFSIFGWYRIIVGVILLIVLW